MPSIKMPVRGSESDLARPFERSARHRGDGGESTGRRARTAQPVWLRDLLSKGLRLDLTVDIKLDLVGHGGRDGQKEGGGRVEGGWTSRRRW